MASYPSRFSKGSGAGALARQTTLDVSVLQRRLNALRAAMPEINRNATLEMNALIAQRVAETSPRDTNRFVRGWLLAAKDVGPVGVAVPAVNASSRHDQYVRYLEKEFKRLSRDRDGLKALIDLWYTSKPTRSRNTPAYAQMTSKLRKIEKWMQRVAEEIQKAKGDESALLFDKERGGRNYSTVRTGVHGGKGRITLFEDRTFVTWHNLEAHATIIERKYQIMGMALREVKAYGAARVKKSLVAGMQRLESAAA